MRISDWSSDVCSSDLLGIRQVALVVNKMDLVGFERARFDEVSKEITAYLASIGATPMVIVPISARDGDNIAKRSSRTPWYDGPTVLSALDGFQDRKSTRLNSSH